MPLPTHLRVAIASLIVLVAARDARAGAGHPGAIVIGKAVPRAGTIRLITDTQRLSLDCTINGQALKSEKLERKVVREEVLAVTGRIVTRVKVTYTTHTHEEQTPGGQPVTTTQPTQGKTFIVAAAGGRVTITDGTGTAVPAVLEALVRKDHKYFGQPDPIWESLPTSAITVGADVPALARGIQRLTEQSMAGGASPGDTWSVGKVSARLRSISGAGSTRQATFATRITARFGSPNGLSMVFDLTGEFTVRVVDGWSVRLDLKGPLEIMGQANAGATHSTQTITYP